MLWFRFRTRPPVTSASHVHLQGTDLNLSARRLRGDGYDEFEDHEAKTRPQGEAGVEQREIDFGMRIAETG